MGRRKIHEGTCEVQRTSSPEVRFDDMNQILISDKIYVTKEMRRKRKVYKILYIVSVLTVITLLVYYVYAEKQRADQEAVGLRMLEQIDDESTVDDDVIVVSLDIDNEEESNPIEVDDNTPVTSSIQGSDGNWYGIDGILTYPKLDISYPILTEESEALLKISLCKYWGPSPNQVGNYCIVGHNYKSGKMFGKMYMASTGDEVFLKDLSGKTVTYSVYNIYTVEPTDVSCTSQLTNGKREITLITCTNYGKQRTVVKCREK